jgi:hypothetical protein
MSKPVAGSFTPLPTIKHSSGHQFQQRGARVYIEDEEGNEIDTITDNRLQAATSWQPVYLTTKQLQALATTWLADNLEEA